MVTKSCKKCAHCKRLYDLTFFLSVKRNAYYCTYLEKLTELNSGCDKWQPREEIYDLSPERFDKAVEDIKYILKCIE